MNRYITNNDHYRIICMFNVNTIQKKWQQVFYQHHVINC